MKMTFSALLMCQPAYWVSTIMAPTMRIRPSVSKPNWVIQLKKETMREPRVPKAARDVVKAVVPVSWPCSEATPSSR